MMASVVRLFDQHRQLLGMAMIGVPILYLATDAWEAIQGGFSAPQLWVTLAAEIAIPVLMVGLAVIQRRSIGLLGVAGASLLGYSYVYFSGTVVYALARDTPDYAALSERLQPWMTMHGAVMVAGGLALGVAVFRAGRTDRWAGIVLMVGVILVAATQTLPEGIQVIAAGVRDLGVIGLGLALIRRPEATGARQLAVRPALR